MIELNNKQTHYLELFSKTIKICLLKGNFLNTKFETQGWMLGC